MNNRVEEHNLPDGSIRNGVNVDCDNTGHLRRRKGFIKVLPYLNTKESFNCPIGTFFRGGKSSLLKFNGSDPATYLAGGLFGETVSFEYFNDVVYLSDGLISKKIKADGSITQWGMDRPPSPVLHRVSGQYGAGIYLGAVTLVDHDGVESGASDIVILDCPENTGIGFSGLPQSSDPQVSSVRVYLSEPNGSTLYLIGDLPIGTDAHLITAGRYDEAMILESEFIGPLPPGPIVRQHGSRMYVADAVGGLWFSEPFQFDRCDIRNNYRQYPDPITIMEPVDGGIFICADKTYFLTGKDPMAFSDLEKSPGRGVFGTGYRDPDKNEAGWMSDLGLVTAYADGSMTTKQRDAGAVVESAESGAILIREQNGIRQAIASLRNTTVSPLASTSFIDAEVIRRGEG